MEPISRVQRVRRAVLVSAAFAAGCAFPDVPSQDRSITVSDADASIADVASTSSSGQAILSPPPQTRDPLHWPFASTSIWNMPMGAGAVYRPANIAPAQDYVLQADQDRIILRPGDPERSIVLNTVDWGVGDRCVPTTEPPQVILTVPFPSSYVVNGDHHNNATAILLGDGRTIVQTQPFSHCSVQDLPTSHYVWAGDRAVDLYGDGIIGAHGGSGLSAIGGTLRLGELRPGGGRIRHALKVNLDQATNLYNCALGSNAGTCSQSCYRWPAVQGYCAGTTNGTNPDLTMGSLLALAPSFLSSSAYASLHSDAARQLAWTLVYYGAYVVDSTAAPSYAFAVEDGPDGNFLTQFLQDWGFNFNPAWMPAHPQGDAAWAQDIATIFAAMQVVVNNGPDSIGGGGAPMQPLAPPISP